ncbi:DUF2986 domain-containing protein [Shewanella sp. JM162201]|uniref:DUF2986 domain-containing protein n=1 Tax=Shewanella jiangmenensis TaxID=2837387 RepID=A0ABS5UZP9_9GAMM|nr:DUF2986 domain-containing protein [Shewanella jiangmenensis]MBT1443692.1 DUF2986 domain-containing protein [Shewanella jiangmenensis]
MNRKKKINQTLIAKDKKKKAKLHGSNKPKYISKAEREKLAQTDAADLAGSKAHAEHEQAPEQTAAQD